MCVNHLLILKCRLFASVVLGQEKIIYISNKLSGDSSAAETTVWVARQCSFFNQGDRSLYSQGTRACASPSSISHLEDWRVFGALKGLCSVLLALRCPFLLITVSLLRWRKDGWQAVACVLGLELRTSQGCQLVEMNLSCSSGCPSGRCHYFSRPVSLLSNSVLGAKPAVFSA